MKSRLMSRALTRPCPAPAALPLVPPHRPAAAPACGTYFVGLGGAGMRALAAVMAGRGGTVWGSERSAAARRELAQLGWHVAADDRVADVAGDDGAVDGGPLELLARSQRLVYSDAVPWDHPQRCLARSWGIPEISYAQMLGRWMAQGEGLAVAGTHGKSTITAMAAQILTTAGQDPSFVCGAAPVAGSRTGGRAGGGRLFLAEACEYRRNFLHLCPQAAVVSGVEADHFETYETREELERGFAEFVERIPPRG
ncbi:MAG: hypothetical protein GTO03_10855, partial [Planctomycetales bacterium]|nr:hypothetical protein [Planctomycetales bacterium]